MKIHLLEVKNLFAPRASKATESDTGDIRQYLDGVVADLGAKIVGLEVKKGLAILKLDGDDAARDAIVKELESGNGVEVQLLNPIQRLRNRILERKARTATKKKPAKTEQA